MPSATPNPTASPAPAEFTVETLAFDSQFLTGAPRIVDIFLPPAYNVNTAESYPVLYAQDGQDMGAVRLKRTLDDLYASSAIRPLIVVAIHATDERLNEYGIAGIPDYKGRGAQADLYDRMLIEEIMPAVTGQYRVVTGPANTAVMGWSLGGLTAFDLAWNHPDIFGRAGVFSGAFWWHTDDSDLQNTLSSRIAHAIVRDGTKRAGLRFWFETGFKDETDDRDGDGLIDTVQDTRELVAELKAKGYTDEDIVVIELPEGEHNQATWAQVLPEFLTWAFPAKN